MVGAADGLIGARDPLGGAPDALGRPTTAGAESARQPHRGRRSMPRASREEEARSARARAATHHTLQTRAEPATTHTHTPTTNHHKTIPDDQSQATAPPPPLPARFEVTTLPVADVDRAKAFYQRLGWRLDIDFKPSPDTRGVQFTPPGSPASIQFGQGTTTMAPGSLQGLLLVVDDIDAARDDLIARGVEVSEIWHVEPGKGRVPGLDPQRRSYFSRATFADPDGNTWVLQEITRATPRPGVSAWTSQRWPSSCTRRPSATARSRRSPRRTTGGTGTRAYMDARQQGSTPEEAAAAAGRYMADVKHIVVDSA